MENREVFMEQIGVPNSAKMIRIINDSMDLFIEEMIYITIYAIGVFVVALVNSNHPALNSMFLLSLYMAMLSVILFLSIKRAKKNAICDIPTKAKVVLFQINLLVFAVCTCVFGIISANEWIIAISINHLIVLIGFAISLTTLFSSTSWEDFKKEIKDEYTNTGLKAKEYVVVCITEIIILMLTFVVSHNLWKRLLIIATLIFALIFVRILVLVRKKRIAAFMSMLENLNENEKIMILQTGDELVLRNELNNRFQIIEKQEEKCKYKYLVILNSKLKKKEGIAHISEYLKTVDSKSETVIIDPSINSQSKKMSKWFSLFSIPCKDLEEIPIDQYKERISNMLL